jgi:hypothetical protein
MEDEVATRRWQFIARNYVMKTFPMEPTKCSVPCLNYRPGISRVTMVVSVDRGTYRVPTTSLTTSCGEVLSQ